MHSLLKIAKRQNPQISIFFAFSFDLIIDPATLSPVSKMVGIAQVVRALGCGPGGRGFESRYSPHLFSMP